MKKDNRSVRVLADLKDAINYDSFIEEENRGDCSVLVFCCEEDESEFVDELLASVERQDGKSFGNLCWEKYSEQYPEESAQIPEDEVLNTRFWAGGGFRALPTVEGLDDANILFVAESQLPKLEENPWICEFPIQVGETRKYIGIQHVDRLVIIPDKEITGR